MERRICPVEKHLMLVACNLVTLCLGLGLAFRGLLSETIGSMIGFNSTFLIGVVLVFLGTNTGKLTDNFRHWDYGLTLTQKLFASLSVFVGALAATWLILDLLHFLNP